MSNNGYLCQSGGTGIETMTNLLVSPSGAVLPVKAWIDATVPAVRHTGIKQQFTLASLGAWTKATYTPYSKGIPGSELDIGLYSKQLTNGEVSAQTACPSYTIGGYPVPLDVCQYLMNNRNTPLGKYTWGLFVKLQVLKTVDNQGAIPAETDTDTDIDTDIDTKIPEKPEIPKTPDITKMIGG